MKEQKNPTLWTVETAPKPPGRPKGALSGRYKALDTLDKLLSEAGSQEQLYRGLKESLRRSPVKFFERFVMPLLPKETKLELKEGGIVWRSFLDVDPTQPGEQKTFQRQTDLPDPALPTS